RRGGPSLSFLILLAVILVPVGIVMLMRSGSRGGIGEKPEATRPVQDPVPSPPVVPKRAWIAVDVGMATSFDSYHLCALDSKNLLYCWGDNRDGQRGDGTIDKNAFTQESPKNIGKDAWRSIAVGTGFTCGVETDGKLYCWGTNVSGQLGRGVEGFETGSRFPEKSGDDTWLMVSAGHSHACGIKADKSLFCWGGNFFGQVGVKTKSENVPSPAKIGDNTWSAVSARDYSTCGITSSSRLYCWGSNGDGVVAKTRKTQVNAPKEIPGALWRSVSLGRNHVCGIDAAKNLYCWGSNHFGQVGNGESSPPGCTSGCAFQEVPLKIGDDTWKTVAAGANTTCAINAEGRLYCWGMSVGEGKDQTTPRKIGDETWSSVSVGTEICAVRQDGDLFCWRPGKDHERRLVSGTSNPQ
ncbi:hypothetical protein KJ865_09110, partial [Myxococcota bacterium]|nr:hypothetical protein [Myxococcota bacterium]MBU1611313.1 hypothetical protein [Pseudomonadota bacterium]